MSVYDTMTPEQRRERATKAARARWDKLDAAERSAQTGKARAVFMQGAGADPQHYLRMAAKSAEVRRARRDAA